MFFKRRMPTAGSFVYFVVCINLINFTVNAQNDVDVDSVLEKIFSPSETSIHTQALRRDIIRRLYDALQREQIEDDLLDYKRSINSLARWDNLPDKRNLAALARAGYIKTLPDEDDEDNDDKRSIAIMAKNGQLPHLPIDEEKRGIEALARNGELYHNKREIQELLQELNDKRNIGSLARSYSFPSYGKRYLGALARNGNFQRLQRNIASIARDGMRYNGKRNLASFLRQSNNANNNNEDKRNLGAAKASGFKPFKRSVDENQRDKRSVDEQHNQDHENLRNKRDADYFEVNDEYASPVYQNQNVFDYEELMKALTGEYPNTDKRFLGSVARSGWFRGPSGPSRYTRIDKRHIGSLARLGWLPSFRSVRRFNRSGRSISDCDREDSTDGKTEDYALAENQIPVKSKQFLFPTVDRILMKIH